MARTVAIAALTALAACKSSELNKPVKQCVAYQKALAACAHEPEQPIATQETAIPRTVEDLDRIATLCESNLAHLKATCH